MRSGCDTHRVQSVLTSTLSSSREFDAVGARRRLGGSLGVAIGVGVTPGYARSQGWLFDTAVDALVGGVGASLLIGAVAGLYPASKAPRLDPADAVRPQ
jgi:putative ABC transport system permease protein